MLMQGELYAQTPVADSVLLSINENSIRNDSHLASFFDKLAQVREGGLNAVNIVHIGDSHIQADFLTDVVRKNLQREFGNAGRGLVVPARVAGTNEPLNIRSFSSGHWTAKRIIHPSKPLPIGVGGITINTAEPGAMFGVRMNDPLTDYSFNKLTLFYDEDVYSFGISILDSSSNELASITPRDKTGAENYTCVSLPSYFNSVSFRTVKQRDDQRYATLFGLNLENGKNGILYHAIGVNGAKYEHYNSANLFARQTKYLKPDLFIISLGTNESVEYPHINKSFLLQVERLVTSLAKHNPDAAFILVTPPDAFIKKVKPNPGIETIRTQIIEFAVENGLAFWDMYKINGGKNSAMEWKMKGLLRPDGIHFSREGYAKQGQLLFEAIMKSYENYVSDRRP
jgi:lysophospholipase L1-like esterase